MTRPVPGQPLVDGEGHLLLVVSEGDEGERLDRLLGRLLAPGFSRSYLSALLAEGRIQVDGRPVRPALRVLPGMSVEGQLDQPAAILPEPEEMPLSILHEDEALIVVDKPVGLVIHPGSGARSGTLVNGLLARYPELATVGRADRPGIVHRLDRETSGVLLVARTNEASRLLVNQFKAKQVHKEYTTFVWGEMPFDNDWIELPIGSHPRHPQLRAVTAEGGQPASTFYTVKRRLGVASLLSVSPRTGRTHQIRVHLQHLGFPVLGDPAYGRDEQAAWERWVQARRAQGLRAPQLARQALHAARITLSHPLSGAEVSYESPLPPDLRDLLEVLEDALR